MKNYQVLFAPEAQEQLTNKKDIIFEYGLNSLNNIASFARFVSYAEELSQLNELFENESSKKTISKYGLNWK